MNCKPGDLAIVVTTLGNKNCDKALGCIVKVIASCGIRRPFGPMWDVEHEFIERVADACLRPITPPAGEVTDSEVRDLFAPNREGVTA